LDTKKDLDAQLIFKDVTELHLFPEKSLCDQPTLTVTKPPIEVMTPA
jgi:hypothetical protein